MDNKKYNVLISESSYVNQRDIKYQNLINIYCHYKYVQCEFISRIDKVHIISQCYVAQNVDNFVEQDI